MRGQQRLFFSKLLRKVHDITFIFHSNSPYNPERISLQSNSSIPKYTYYSKPAKKKPDNQSYRYSRSSKQPSNVIQTPKTTSQNINYVLNLSIISSSKTTNKYSHPKCYGKKSSNRTYGSGKFGHCNNKEGEGSLSSMDEEELQYKIQTGIYYIYG